MTGPETPTESSTRSSVTYGKSAMAGLRRPAVRAPFEAANSQWSESLTSVRRNGRISWTFSMT